MKKVFLTFKTLKFLKISQILYRIKRIFFKNKSTPKNNVVMVEPKNKWQKTEFLIRRIRGQTFNFINYKTELNFPKDWNNKKFSRLWLYNLHYFNELVSQDALIRKKELINLLDAWVKHNPIGKGVGWEAYPISLRTVNIFKAWLNGFNFSKNITESVYTQIFYLNNHLEKHLLGNHYLTNLKSLLFGGVIFNNNHWIEASACQLEIQLDEQILTDGAHFELSPMYQRIIIIDLLDLINLGNAYPKLFPKNLYKKIFTKAKTMIEYSLQIDHPDENIPFFNDATFGIAPTRNQIIQYSKDLGIEVNKPSETFKIFPKSGISISANSTSKIIYNCSDVVASYIPGHTHANALSFELSLGAQRFIVNSGINTYDSSKDRLRQRSTESFNTVEIDGKNSTEVWSSFRVANRASITQRYIEEIDGLIKITGEHDGYSGLCNEILHKRQLNHGINSLVIKDTINGPFNIALSRLFFHPSLDISIKMNDLIIKDKFYEMKIDLSNVNYDIKDSVWNYEFNKKVKNKMLLVKFHDGNSLINIVWKKLD